METYFACIIMEKWVDIQDIPRICWETAIKVGKSKIRQKNPQQPNKKDSL